MTFSKSVVLLSLLAAQASAAVVTLYGLSAAPVPVPTFAPIVDVAGTIAYKPINPSPGSPVTTYEVEEIRSRVALYDPVATETFTLISEPTTLTYTRVEGLSGVTESYNAFPTPVAIGGLFRGIPDFSQECKYDIQNNKAECLLEQLDPLDGHTNVKTVDGTPTTVVTYGKLTALVTGGLTPIATITVSNGAAGFGVSRGLTAAIMGSAIPALVAWIAL